MPVCSVAALAAGSTGIDTSVADAILDLTTKALGMFSVFPLNIFLGASLLGIGIGVYRKLKHS